MAARRSQLTIRTGLWNNWSVTAGRGIGGREDPLATPKSPPPPVTRCLLSGEAREGYGFDAYSD